MNCQDARTIIIQTVCGNASDTDEKRLQSHLQECTQCKDVLDRYEQVHAAVNDLPTEQLPDGVVEACEDLLAENDLAENSEDILPANPEPMASFRQRSTIFIACLVGFLLVALGSVYFVTKYDEPVRQTSEVVARSGTIKVGFPGEAQWDEAPDLPGISERAILQTGQDGFLHVRTIDGSMNCWVDNNTTVAWPTSRSIKLARGTALIEHDSGETADEISLTTSPSIDGKVTTGDGTFEAEATLARLLVTCLSGTVTLQGEKDAATLKPGQKGVVMEGALLNPPRETAPGRAGSWRHRFSQTTNTLFPRRQNSFLPHPRSSADIPPEIGLSDVKIALTLRGALLTGKISARIHNKGKSTWEGTLSLDETVWASSVVNPPSRLHSVAPGDSTTITDWGVFSLLPSDQDLVFGVMPEALPRGVAEQVEISIQAQASDYASIKTTTHDISLQPSDGEITGQTTLSADRFKQPLMVKARLRQDSPPRIRWFQRPGTNSPVGLVAWQPEFVPAEEVKQIRHYIMAFDATWRDSASRGYAFGHALADNLTARLSNHTRLLVAAYDGEVKLLPAARGGVQSIARERMLGSLWGLKGSGKRSGTKSLMKWCSDFPAQKPSLAFVLTHDAGKVDKSSIAPSSKDQSHPRLYNLNSSGQQMPEEYRQLCASSGGASIKLPADLSAAEAATYTLKNLAWPGYSKLSLNLEGAITGKMLTPAGITSNTPIVFVLVPPDGLDSVSGQIEAERGANRLQADFTFSVPADSMPPKLPEKLLRE